MGFLISLWGILYLSTILYHLLPQFPIFRFNLTADFFKNDIVYRFFIKVS